MDGMVFRGRAELIDEIVERFGAQSDFGRYPNNYTVEAANDGFIVVNEFGDRFAGPYESRDEAVAESKRRYLDDRDNEIDYYAALLDYSKIPGAFFKQLERPELSLDEFVDEVLANMETSHVYNVTKVFMPFNVVEKRLAPVCFIKDDVVDELKRNGGSAANYVQAKLLSDRELVERLAGLRGLKIKEADNA